MTRRERIERKVEKRREWATGRDKKAEGLNSATPDTLRHDWAFITQPGHIPERARMNRRDEKAHEHRTMGAYHRGKAAGLESQLKNTIFSDDPDAIEALKAKIEKKQKRQELMKTANRCVRKKDLAGVMALGVSESMARALFEPDCCGRVGYADYQLKNNNADIRRLKARIVDIERRQVKTAEAEASGGLRIQRGRAGGDGAYCQITFVEKPERHIIEALKTANFLWSGGSWTGLMLKIPTCVLQLESEATA